FCEVGHYPLSVLPCPHPTFYVVYLHPFFFFNAPATTEIYTLSLHDALPISMIATKHRIIITACPHCFNTIKNEYPQLGGVKAVRDRKSTRLNSSHVSISYAVFCLKKKRKTIRSNESWDDSYSKL